MMKAAAFSSVAAIIRVQEIQFEQWMPHRLQTAAKAATLRYDPSRVDCLQTTLKTPAKFPSHSKLMERMMGFEPTTSTLARLRSTPELHPHIEGSAKTAPHRRCTQFIENKCEGKSFFYFSTYFPVARASASAAVLAFTVTERFLGTPLPVSESITCDSTRPSIEAL